MKEIDCRNKACPAPVVTTKKMLEESAGQPVRVLVDNGAPRENVTRFATGRGYSVMEESVADGWALTITAENDSSPLPAAGATRGPATILVATDRLGYGPDELGKLLMKNFFITLLELTEPPEKIFFINSGVTLTSEGSELLEPLAKLSEAGVAIQSCGICLDYFGLREKLAAGTITNMFTIAETLLQSGNVIRL